VALYAVVLVVSVLVGCLSWRRSGGSMTRYRLYTGAPLVWVLLGAVAVSALLAERAGDADLALGLFTGGLIGTGLVQVVLLRRSAAAHHGEDRPLR
jgi:hypothetical protein